MVMSILNVNRGMKWDVEGASDQEDRGLFSKGIFSLSLAIYQLNSTVELWKCQACSNFSALPGF